MGNIAKIVGKIDLGKPDSNPKEGKWNIPFSVELREDIHIHWQDIRIEMTAQDFDDFCTSLNNAHKVWVDMGKPNTSDKVCWMGRWVGEDTLDHYKDRLQKLDSKGRLRHHFKYFPRTQGDKLYYDNVFIIEKQKGDGRYHFHYKNFRWELGKKQAKQIANLMQGILKTETNEHN